MGHIYNGARAHRTAHTPAWHAKHLIGTVKCEHGAYLMLNWAEIKMGFSFRNVAYMLRKCIVFRFLLLFLMFLLLLLLRASVHLSKYIQYKYARWSMAMVEHSRLAQYTLWKYHRFYAELAAVFTLRIARSRGPKIFDFSPVNKHSKERREGAASRQTTHNKMK